MTLIDVMKRLKPHLPLPVIRGLEFGYYRLYLRACCSYLDLATGAQCAAAGVPNASLRYRVNGRPELADFLAQGELCKNDLVRALSRTGRELGSFRNVLDFGCGCGRTLRWFAAQAHQVSFHGTDIDDQAVAFCKKAFPAMEFAVNQALPPLRYRDGEFELIYSISVLTHLDEQYQFRWLEELQRICAPGGIVLLSVHGRHCWGNLPAQMVQAIERDGFHFCAAGAWKGIFPEWYQTAFHTERYVRDTFARYFEVLDYLPRGIGDFQDLVILQKRAGGEEH